MNRLTKRLLIGCGVAAGLALGFLVEERIRGGLQLRALERDLRARGELLTVAELVSTATNQAGRLVTPTQLTGLLPGISPAGEPQSPDGLPPGRKAVLWRLDAWQTRDGATNTWDNFARDLASVWEQLPAVRAAFTNPVPRLVVDYTAGFNTLLPHLGPIKTFSQTLRCATLRDLREGNLEAALENLLTAKALLDLQRHEGLIISQLVRNAIGHLSLDTVWQALPAEGWSDAQLARLQAAWQEPEFIAGMADGLRLERAVAAWHFTGHGLKHADLLSVYEMAAPFGDDSEQLASDVPLIEPLVAALQRARRSVFVEVWRFAWAAQDLAFHHRRVQQALDAAARAVRERSAAGFRKSEAPGKAAGRPAWDPQELGFQDKLRHWFCLSMMAPTDTTLRKAAQTDCHAQLAVTAIALQRYHLRHGRWPERLAELVPAFLPEMPRDWMDGRPLRYRRNADGTFTLYSVGWDGRDDGGDPRAEDDGRPTMLRGRDIVWPQPATEAELLAAGAMPRSSRMR